MSIIRSVYKRPDGSCLVTLPKSWVEIIEGKYGGELREIYMGFSGENIIIKPKFSDENE